eukprot:8522020-Lingulodinium_polyedra.AAC.1
MQIRTRVQTIRATNCLGTRGARRNGPRDAFCTARAGPYDAVRVQRQKRAAQTAAASQKKQTHFQTIRATNRTRSTR